jgi:methylated-DNA-protein-cysteine methyltransferase-like protein
MKPKDNYYELVFELTRRIPPGRVSTYGAIADYLSLGSARMVGWALNNSMGTDIPAHRVVNRKGELSGRNHFAHPTLMQERLEKEGIKVVNNKIVDMDKHFWHPEEYDQ